MNSPDIRVVLVDPSHPGNIGAVARAIKNMDLGQLVLVRPRDFPHPEARARASGADDVLARARVVQDLDAALADCRLVLATTSRLRDQNFRVLDVRDAATEAWAEAQRSPVALLFGAERNGLTNEDLQYAHALVTIPASSEYASLNLAMAVQIVTYELFRARGFELPRARPEAPPATAAQMRLFYQHLEQVLEEVDFRDRTASGRHLMNRLRRLFQRAEADQNEINILRGILTAVQAKRRHAGSR